MEAEGACQLAEKRIIEGRGALNLDKYKTSRLETEVALNAAQGQICKSEPAFRAEQDQRHTPNAQAAVPAEGLGAWQKRGCIRCDRKIKNTYSAWDTGTLQLYLSSDSVVLSFFTRYFCWMTRVFSLILIGVVQFDFVPCMYRPLYVQTTGPLFSLGQNWLYFKVHYPSRFKF